MTIKQRTFYIQLWHRVCDANVWDRSDDALRHAEVAAALDGNHKHFRDFSNKDFDRVIAHFTALIDADDFDPAHLALDAAEAAEASERRRLIWRINQLSGQLPRGYAATILRQRFHIMFDEELNECSLDELTKIRNTLWARLQNRQPSPQPTTKETPS